MNTFVPQTCFEGILEECAFLEQQSDRTLTTRQGPMTHTAVGVAEFGPRQLPRIRRIPGRRSAGIDPARRRKMAIRRTGSLCDLRALVSRRTPGYGGRRPAGQASQRHFLCESQGVAVSRRGTGGRRTACVRAPIASADEHTSSKSTGTATGGIDPTIRRGASGKRNAITWTGPRPSSSVHLTLSSSPTCVGITAGCRPRVEDEGVPSRSALRSNPFLAHALRARLAEHAGLYERLRVVKRKLAGFIVRDSGL